nr:DHA2 family efflux MFS transporter permease subunit [Flexivirga oryzae]
MTLAVLVLGGIAAILDTTVVTIALHDLVIDLQTTVTTVQWVTTAYLLALTAVIPAVGWAEARLGGKRLWVAALTTFLVGSTLCALAWNPVSLIAFRVLQGLGAGVLMTLMMTLAMRAVRGKAMARVTAAMSLPMAVGPIVGPVLGGTLLDWAGWRWIFLINLPLCLAGIVAALRVLPDDAPTRDTARPTLDAVGLGLLAPGLALTVYGLSRCGDSGAPGGDGLTAVLVAAGLGLVAIFVGWALRRGDAALIRVALFARRSVGSASVMMFLVGMTLYGSMFLLPLYWQQARGESALGAAILLMPQGVGSLLSRVLVARLVERFGAPIVSCASFLLAAVATAPFAFADTTTSTWWLGAVLFVRGLGLGAVMVPIISSAYVGLEPTHVAHASMQTRALQQLGGAFGVAIGAVLLQALAGHGLIGGFHTAFWVFTALAVLASLASFALPAREKAPAR